MKTSPTLYAQLTIIGTLLFVAACATVLPQSEEPINVRSKLTQLQSDAPLARRAPVEIKEAELAVRATEVPQEDQELADHLVLMADRKVDIATARAQSRLLLDQRKTLSDQREKARLDARTREADSAHRDAAFAREEASEARMGSETAQQRNDDLQRQIAELNAKSTNRGLVVTLGDVLFASGKADLQTSALPNLDKLAAFLKKYTDRTVVIEGHTDSVGSDDANLGLSQRRANAVMDYLTDKGITADRLGATGKGETTPVADNESANGRQQNRRVEVIISNVMASANKM